MPWNLLESEEGDLFEHEDGTLVTDEDGAPCCCGGTTGLCCNSQVGCGFDLIAPTVPIVDPFDFETTVDFPFVSSSIKSGWMVGTKRQVQEVVDVRPDCNAANLIHIEEFGTFTGGTGDPKARVIWALAMGSTHPPVWPPYPDPSRFSVALIGEIPDAPHVLGAIGMGDPRGGGINIGFVLGIGDDKRWLMWAANRDQSAMPTITADKPIYTPCTRIEWNNIDAHVDPQPGPGGAGGGDVEGDIFTVFHQGLIPCGESAPLPTNCERCRFPLEPGRPNCANCSFCNGCG